MVINIMLNENSEIIGYAIVGKIENGIDVEVPQEVIDSDLLSFKYINQQFVKNQDYVNKLLDSYKDKKISDSKSLLNKYISENPLKSSCHNNIEYEYTATFEKQSLFTSKFTAHITKVQNGITDVMTWNRSGELCEEWTDPECIQFIIDMDKYITPLVKHQQYIELSIKQCKTKEEVDVIVIDFSNNIK